MSSICLVQAAPKTIQKFNNRFLKSLECRKGACGRFLHVFSAIADGNELCGFAIFRSKGLKGKDRKQMNVHLVKKGISQMVK
jgi:hypothetical protein